MSDLTLHAMDDDLAAALRRHAEETGASLNQAAKGLLALALGVAEGGKRATPGLSSCFVIRKIRS